MFVNKLSEKISLKFIYFFNQKLLYFQTSIIKLQITSYKIKKCHI